MQTSLTDAPAYRDARLPIEQRVDDLLGRMTTAEKVAQLGSLWVYEVQQNDQSLSRESAASRMPHGIGQITRLAGGSSLSPVETAALANAIQHFLVEETRLGIPALIHDECCSGFLASGATNFPQIIGLASTWEPELAERMTQVIRTQMRALGVHHGLAPVLDIARDPRWGRTEETFGEDPYLNASMGTAYIRGLQGDDWTQGVMATGKHFVGYSASEGGLNWAPAHINARELREVYLAPFEAAVRVAKLASMMPAYHEIDGEPCSSSHELMTRILRDEWGFDGLVVSDYMAINQLADYHQLARDKAHAAHLALEAGMDLELPTIDAYGQPLLDALAAGDVPLAWIDRSVRRILALKFAFGLFEQPFVEPDAVPAVFDTPAQRELAREIARKSIVLLKNEGDLLPLDKGLRSLAVIGPNADSTRNLLGDYSYPAHIETLITLQGLGLSDHALPESMKLVDNYAEMISIVAAIRQAVGPQTQVHYAPGCAVNSESTDGFAAAVAAAQQAEVAVVVVGDKAGLTPDCTSGEFRDSAHLALPGVQQALVEAILATGTPVVLVLVTGRPYAIPQLVDAVPAVVQAWLPGAEGAPALAEMLFGDVNPGGKLPITFPRHVGQVPLFYGHRPSGARSFFYGPYMDESNEPLFPFGYGLSYTRFAFENLAVTPAQVATSGEVQVTVEVVNTGSRAGDEVVQLYTRTDGASVTRPVKELRGFRRVHLAPSERARVTFTLSAELFAYYDAAMQLAVEPTSVQVMVGSSSAHLPLHDAFALVGEKQVLGRRERYFCEVEVGPT
ncbi:glycoside hydrolase family 3 N-terminal domain-containing protein [Caldilinea sp.]|uniref:glycoside hydrolase family 3 N-terminal domain-containing protein n=1 Tax=Caldilinea sp. TaxID=2293560 RepID=UPI002BF5DDDF|nr:glycoside hydrolase family 3 C-terminal domain-containing protein [Anaerolineales bacterium]HQY90666.1 glycoside hydrolase family 3 N-terminal domain-containing protein [Caldilinea sp.]HRA66802.1 glycoside hydrolase family 3 N-terminal domain-containing protein [Caldilinea sp.]